MAPIIEPIRTKEQREQFLRVPWSIYQGDPAWVPPLLYMQRHDIDPGHPFFDHADWQGFIAYEGGRPVGRISAQIDRLNAEQGRPDAGWFGMLEAPDDAATFAALLGAAESWLAERGMRTAAGPFNLSINQELGVLVEGFDTPPYMMMGHSRPYYDAHIKAAGYRGVKDLLAYLMDPDFQPPRVMGRLLDQLGDRLVMRRLDKKRKEDELRTMCAVFNDAWSGNWGFVPFTEKEFLAIGNDILMLVDDDYIHIAELDGEPVAFIVLMPNINEAIADLDGKLLPFGWAKALWRLKVRGVHSARVPLMGVRRAFHHTRFGPGLAFAVIDEARKACVRTGIESVEMSWILDDNMGMRNIIETIGGHVSKRYRMYEKALGAGGE